MRCETFVDQCTWVISWGRDFPNEARWADLKISTSEWRNIGWKEGRHGVGFATFTSRVAGSYRLNATGWVCAILLPACYIKSSGNYAPRSETFTTHRLRDERKKKIYVDHRHGNTQFLTENWLAWRQRPPNREREGSVREQGLLTRERRAVIQSEKKREVGGLIVTFYRPLRSLL